MQRLWHDRRRHHLRGERHGVERLGRTQHLVNAAVDGWDVEGPGVPQRLLHGDGLLFLPLHQWRLPTWLKVAGLVLFLLLVRNSWSHGGGGTGGDVGLRHGGAVHWLPQGPAGVEAVWEDNDVIVAWGHRGCLAADLKWKMIEAFRLQIGAKWLCCYGLFSCMSWSCFRKKSIHRLTTHCLNLFTIPQSAKWFWWWDKSFGDISRGFLRLRCILINSF